MLKSNDEQELKLQTLEGFTDNDCCKIGSHECIVGKVVAIQLEPTRFEYSHSARQLVLVEGGAGASGERGRVFYGICLATGERGIWRRIEAMGVLRHDRIPCWAFEMLAKIRRERGEIDDGNPSNDSGGAEIHIQTKYAD